MTFPPGLTVGYVTSGSISSRLIEWRSAGGPSHATTLAGAGWVIDARLEGGVRRRPVDYLAGANVEWWRVPASEMKVRATLLALSSQIGKPYDWQDIVDFAVPQRFQALWRDPAAWICSELQGWAEERGEICPPLAVSANRLAPADMRLVNSALGAVRLPGPLMD